MNDSRRVKRSSFVLAAFALCLTLGAIYIVGPSRRHLDVDTIPETGRQSAQVVDPCALLMQSGEFYTTMGYNAPYVDYTVEDYVLESHVVAKAVISATRAPRFETIDGNPPGAPIVTPQPTGTPDPFSDEPDDFVPSRILSPVILEATEIYSGTAAAGYVVARWGGVSSACPDYLHTSPGDVMVGQPGDEGIAFMETAPQDWQADPPSWFTHLVNTANEISSPGNVYAPMVLRNWYHYDTGAGEATTELLDGTFPIDISTLESEVQAAVP